MAKSVDKHPKIKQGLYKGLWSGYSLVIILDDETKTEPIKTDEGVRGNNCDCDVYVNLEGEITVQ